MALREIGGAGLRRVATRRAGAVALALALYLGAGVAATWPAVQDAHARFLATDATEIRGAPAAGDHLQSVYRLWLFGHQFGRRAAVWQDPYSFQEEAPEQANPAAWPLGVPFWPLVAAFGPVIAWNLLVLLSFAAAGGLTLLWLRELGVAYPAALAGGLAFALAPYRVAQSAGHLLGLIAVLLPLALLAWERGRRGGRRRWYLLAAAALASIPLSGQVHLALGAIPFFALYAVCRTRERWPLAEAALAVALAVASGFLVHASAIEPSTLAGGRSLDEVRRYSAEWIDFVQREVDDGLEEFVLLGWALPVLALGGLVVLLFARRWLLTVALVVGTAVPVLLALGTNLPSYEWLWEAFPPLRYPRVPERLLPVACLALAALAALAVGRLSNTVLLGRRIGTAVAAIAVAVLAVDLRYEAGVFDAYAADEANEAYDALPRRPEGGVLELPVFLPDRHEGSVYLYYALQAQRPRPLGYATIAPPAGDATARRLERLNCGDWDAETRALLERIGVRYVVLHRALFPARRKGAAWFAERGLARNGFRALASDGDVTSYRAGRPPSLDVPSEPPRSLPIFCEDADDSRSAFWIHGSGLLTVELDASPPTRTRVSIDRAELPARVVSRGATIEVVLLDDAWHLVVVESEKPNVRVGGAAFSAL